MEPAPLQQIWTELNRRHFKNVLPPIDIVLSRRLTGSAGLFVSRGGPLATLAGPRRRLIRLSAPLLQAVCDATAREAELRGTLAHEMIHQWQFDVLKRRPNHGPDFRRKMEAMNRDGLEITIHHDLAEAVRPWLRYAWRCLACGQVYERQRRTIRPGRHRCGACRGKLKELMAAQDGAAGQWQEEQRADSRWLIADSKTDRRSRKGIQLSFEFSMSGHQP
jgi:predicted SprT family Zn-dependent metalloprotease